MTGKVKMKSMLGAATLAYAPLIMASEKAGYPTEKVMAFVVGKLDAASLPSVYRPKKEKGKNTFADYGYTAQKVEEKEAIVAASDGVHRLSIQILQQDAKGIYVCVAEASEDTGKPKEQSVILLKWKDSKSLLKGHESIKEFTACPVIGGSENGFSSNNY
jgi:hypothetical protein